MRLLSWAGLIVLGTAGAATARTPDDTPIRALEQRQAEAWNAHDIKAYGALFTDEADVVNVLGWHWRSRAELEAKLGRGFGSVFAHSQMTIGDVSVEYLKPDIAVAHVEWSMIGALSPTGSAGDAPEHGIQTQVLVRQSGAWRIAHFQNTNSLPERPMPAAR